MLPFTLTFVFLSVYSFLFFWDIIDTRNEVINGTGRLCSVVGRVKTSFAIPTMMTFDHGSPGRVKMPFAILISIKWIMAPTP